MVYERKLRVKFSDITPKRYIQRMIELKEAGEITDEEYQTIAVPNFMKHYTIDGILRFSFLGVSIAGAYIEKFL